MGCGARVRASTIVVGSVSTRGLGRVGKRVLGSTEQNVRVNYKDRTLLGLRDTVHFTSVLGRTNIRLARRRRNLVCSYAILTHGLGTTGPIGANSGG